VWRDVDHGEMCDCMLLARAIGAPSSCIDYSYCRNVLQRHWNVTCNHGGRLRAARTTPQLPPLDAHDPLQAILLANAPPG
jgi:hypothetical protein